MTRRGPAVVVGLVGLVGLVACGGGSPSAERATTTAPAPASSSSDRSTTASTSTTTTTRPVEPRPAWLGERELPLRPDGLGEIQPTPPELVDRRFAAVDHLPRPENDDFTVTVEPVPQEVVARSTWSDACPVGLDELHYLTLPFTGFDGLAHTGELIVNVDAVDVVTAGFEHLYEIGFPIEEMRITRPAELDAHPTGDGNNTGAFVCRPTVGSTNWSQHAYGLAVDINPFHNPYVRNAVVIPELASAYVDRSDHRPGMLTAEDLAGFVDGGWGWGGRWSSSKDYMHVSATGG
ncbi:MAG: M15 family metallopeptidase [Acidimicrobiales bacterium]|nr:M15 family metallopeptidase [Acidimicrobiales bacterium]